MSEMIEAIEGQCVCGYKLKNIQSYIDFIKKIKLTNKPNGFFLYTGQCRDCMIGITLKLTTDKNGVINKIHKNAELVKSK